MRAGELRERIEERLQVGSFYIDELDGNKRKPFVDGQGNPVAAFLKLNGNPFRDGANKPIIGVLPLGTTYPYKKHRGSYEEKDFNILLT